MDGHGRVRLGLLLPDGPQGTFDAILATPVSVDEVTTGEIIWAATRVADRRLLRHGDGRRLRRHQLAARRSRSSRLALLPGLMFAAISLAYTAIAKSVSSLNYFFATYVTPQFWLSGVFFPLSEMPGWVETVGLVHARLPRRAHLPRRSPRATSRPAT